MFKKGILIGGFILVFVTGAVGLWLTPGKFSAAPDVSLKFIDGRMIHLQDLQGKPVLITFWATTCRSCIKEMPHLISLYDELSVKGFEIIGVAMSYDPPNQVIELINRGQVSYPIALDIDGSIAKAFNNVSLTPTSFLISPEGKIIKYKRGEIDMGILRQQILDLLSQQSKEISEKIKKTDDPAAV
jgi:peroxiredoxin